MTQAKPGCTGVACNAQDSATSSLLGVPVRMEGEKKNKTKNVFQMRIAAALENSIKSSCVREAGQRPVT